MNLSKLLVCIAGFGFAVACNSRTNSESEVESAQMKSLREIIHQSCSAADNCRLKVYLNMENRRRAMEQASNLEKRLGLLPPDFVDWMLRESSSKDFELLRLDQNLNGEEYECWYLLERSGQSVPVRQLTTHVAKVSDTLNLVEQFKKLENGTGMNDAEFASSKNFFSSKETRDCLRSFSKKCEINQLHLARFIMRYQLPAAVMTSNEQKRQQCPVLG
ncbi:MAG: hypothetical protein ACO3A4_12700 [Silvanigrellaceae bacterium]